MLKQTLFFIPLMAMLLLQGCGDSSQDDGIQDIVAVTEFKLTDTTGKQLNVKKELNSFNLENTQGKVILYDIFATWCPPCRASATHLTSLQNKYPNDLVVIGLSIEDDIDAKKLEVFKVDNNAKYTVTYGEQSILLGRSIASAIHVGQSFPIPLMVMYKDGKYVTHYTGIIPEEVIESDIKLALGLH